MTVTDSDVDVVDATECVSLREGQRVFERYVLEEMVGRGGMGTVWKARDKTLDRIVALMFLPDRLYRDAAVRDELKRETRRCLELAHPNIVRVHDFLEDGDRAAIAMEDVDGRNLSELRMERPSRCFKPEELSVWVTELCAAIDYVHGKGRCLHRELQPGCLLVDSLGALKITDFGFVFRTGGHGESNPAAPLGSMSPQQVLGEPPSPSDDIYAAGATFYELLTGKPPFHGDDLSTQILEVIPESMAERRRNSGMPESTLPVAWEETIAACLAKEPQWRPATGHEIAFLLGLAVDAPAEAARPRARRGADMARPRASRGARAFSSAEKWATILSILKWLKDPRLAGALSRVGGQMRIWMAQWKRTRLSLAPWNLTPFQRVPWKPMITCVAILCAPMIVGVVILPRLVRKHSLSAPPVAVAAPALVPALAPLRAPAAAVTTATPPVAPSIPPMTPAAPPAPASAEARAIPNVPPETADQRALTEPIPPPAPEAGAQVRIETVPPGIPFQVMADSPDASAPSEVQGSGVSPATLILPKGAYRIVYSLPGQPSRMTSVKVPAAGSALFQQEFPHGVVKVHCQPERAEVICDGRAVGAGPVDLFLPPGRHEIGARWNGHDARTRTIELADAGEQTLAFEFPASSSSSSSKRSHHHAKKKPEDDSLFAKIGRGFKNLFESDSDKKH